MLLTCIESHPVGLWCYNPLRCPHIPVVWHWWVHQIHVPMQNNIFQYFFHHRQKVTFAFLGMSTCIVSKPCTDTLNVFINTIDNSWMQLTHLVQVVWYWDICLSLCNIRNFLWHLRYQCWSCPLLSPVTGLKIFITIAYEYIPKWWMNPTTIWRHDGGLKLCEIKSVINFGRWRIYPWLINSFSQQAKHN